MTTNIFNLLKKCACVCERTGFNIWWGPPGLTSPYVFATSPQRCGSGSRRGEDKLMS